MEKDDELKGVKGSSYDFGARMYDSRIGRWFSSDKLKGKYPGFSPYNFSTNSPIQYIDSDGNEPIDPRTGLPIVLDPVNGARPIYGTLKIDDPNIKPINDVILSERLNNFYHKYMVGDGGSSIWDKGREDKGKLEMSRDLISELFTKKTHAQLKTLLDLEGTYTDYISYSRSQTSVHWRKAAKLGNYSFIKNGYAESSFFFNYHSATITKVESNFVTKYIHLKRNMKDEFNITSVTEFKIVASEIKTRIIEKKTWFSTTQSIEYYRVLRVREETTNYNQNNNSVQEDVNSGEVKNYETEQILTEEEVKEAKESGTDGVLNINTEG